MEVCEYGEMLIDDPTIRPSVCSQLLAGVGLHWGRSGTIFSIS